MRAILAGGGTGGHVIPALAIAQELCEQFAAEVTFIGTARGIEMRLVPAAGYDLRLVPVGKLKGVSLATRARTLIDLPAAVLKAWRLIHELRPHVMIGVGGYASGPAMLAASLANLPTLAFEPNFVPGFANRVVAPMVSAAAVHFPETGAWFRNCRVTGVPVRRRFFEIPSRPAGGAPTLLVFGGSQGAAAINHVVTESLAALAAEVPGIRIVHQTGEKDLPESQAAYQRAHFPAEVSPFIDDMPSAFARADLLMCRSGASTVAEITAAGKPAIFVPFPRAADDHQLRNAQALERAGAAIVIPENELTSARVVGAIAALLKDRARLARMSAAARKLAHPRAAAEIAEMAGRLAGYVHSPGHDHDLDHHAPNTA